MATLCRVNEAHRAQPGKVEINIGVAAPVAPFPFSGMKESFFGDLHGRGMDGVNLFTERQGSHNSLVGGWKTFQARLERD